MAVKATVSDFEGKYKAYSILTNSGWAYKEPHYGRAVDIGDRRSYALTTDGLQELYGDTLALQVRNQQDGRPWPMDARILKQPVKLVSLALSFNKISGLMSEMARTGQDPVAQAFAKAAEKHGLEPLGQFFIIPSSVLPETPHEEETVSETTLDDAAKRLKRNPHNLIVTVEGPERLLDAAHKVPLMVESQKPGFIPKNKFILTGLYLGRAAANDREVKSLPVPVQDRAMISQVTSELRRTYG